MPKAQKMYNLTVDEAHTFFVGDGQWLVHNICMRGGISVQDGLAHIKYLRKQYNLGKWRNVAYARENITTGKPNELFAASGENTPRNFEVPSASDRQFTTEIVVWDRYWDSEVTILEYIASKASPDETGTIFLFSEGEICPSCRGVIDQFGDAFPNITLFFNEGP
jgi:hypothetical protein